MKSMLEEYGKIVVVSIVIAIMIGAAALLRGANWTAVPEDYQIRK